MLAPVLRYMIANQVPSFDPEIVKKSQAKIVDIFNSTLNWNKKSAADCVEAFVRMLGLPGSLREVGVTKNEDVQAIAEKTMTDVWGGGKRQMDDSVLV